MIPDHIIETAMDAYVENFPGTRCMRINMEAALEAIIAAIWDEGERAGYIHGQHDTHRFDPGPDYTETPNPYRNEHA